MIYFICNQNIISNKTVIGTKADCVSEIIFDMWGFSRFVIAIEAILQEAIAMVTVTSKEAKERFGVLVDTARREPVTITKHNRPTVVVVSSERYAELEALEESVLIAAARQAEKGGFLTADETADFLREQMNAGD